MGAKFIETISGSVINVDNIESIEIEDFDLAYGTGRVAVAYMTSGKRHQLTNSCGGNDERAENYPAILARVIVVSPSNRIITTIPNETIFPLAETARKQMPKGFSASIVSGGVLQ